VNLLDLMVRIGVDDQASSKVEGITSGAIAKGVAMGNAMWDVTKQVAGAVSSAAQSVVGGAVEAYSTYEQMVGGVDKLFGDASGKLQQYAAQAYQTSGMSANQYMQQATSFSAALINSLGGDTSKAADMADVAMRAMSDNVNVFGSNAEDVQNAIMGISRQNYTMLDNLKLGYAGTKQGMQQLIDDANKWGAANGEASDLSIDSFADCVQAIQQVQEAQGIAGTTAKEAAGTIEGSVTMAKAAWENLLTGLADPDADVGALVGNLLGAVDNVVTNVAPRVGQVFTTVVSYLPTAVSQVGQTLLPVVADAAAGLVGAAASALGTVREYLAGVDWAGEAQSLLAGIASVVGPLLSQAAQLLPYLLVAVAQLMVDVMTYMSEHAQEIVDALTMVIQLLAAAIGDNLPTILAAAVTLFLALATAVINDAPQMLAAIGTLLLQAVAAVAGAVGQMLSAGIEFVGGLLSGATQKGAEVLDWFAGLPGRILSALGDLGGLLVGAGRSVIDGFLSGLKGAWDGVTGFVGGIADWIAEHKGPIEYDRRLLVPHGMAIMRGLGSGIERAFGSEVEPLVSGIGGRLADAMATGAPGFAWATARAGTPYPAPGRTTVVNQSFSTRVVRSDQDMYAAAAILSRSAMRTAMEVS
jgi:phage-related protein